jgi:hypothetical protein
MFPFDAAAYGPVIQTLLSLAGGGRRLMPLAGGMCVSEQARQQIGQLETGALFAPRPVADRDFAEAARSGLFLYFSCLDEAHKVAQDIATPTGSYWHGILHRQEPDFSNAAYWFRRVKQHEIFPALREAAIEQGFQRQSDRAWDPFRFIDACESVHRKRDEALERTLVEVQLAEWQLLFDYCCRRAVEQGR